MIEAIRLYSSHSLFGLVAEGIPALLRSLHTIVNHVALGILMQVIISLPLFYLHHNLFILGFIIGFIFDKQVRVVVDKVNAVYNAHRTLLERVLFFGGGGFFAILTMPTSTIIAALYYSAQWGALLYQSSVNRYRQPLAASPVPAAAEGEGETPLVIETPADDHYQPLIDAAHEIEALQEAFHIDAVPEKMNTTNVNG